MTKYIFLSLALSFLTGCGGSSTSSGGASQVSLPAAAPAFTPGIYGGTQTLTLTAVNFPSIAPITNTAGFEAEVTPTSITILDIDVINATGPLDAVGQFALPNATLEFSLDDGARCMGQLGYNGQVLGTSLTGTLVGSLNCDGITLSVSGTFNASEGAPAGKRSSGELQSTIRNYLRGNRSIL
jgi:hypothetical protein